MRKKHNVFLLMTGLYEKIHELQNEDTLTFLYHAPKFEMRPLNKALVTMQYQKIFQIGEEHAMAMADLVKGYPYAYQVLGYLCYKRQRTYDEVTGEFDAYLGEYVYDKIWSEMSATDRKFAFAMAESKSSKMADIREIADMSSEKAAVYRNRLLKKGIVTSETYGYLDFTLPRFRDYVNKKIMRDCVTV